jgi:hypothetical protein
VRRQRLRGEAAASSSSPGGNSSADHPRLGPLNVAFQERTEALLSPPGLLFHIDMNVPGMPY